MVRASRLLAYGILILAPLPLTGQTAGVPSTDAEWRQLGERLQQNPFHLAGLDRDLAVAIVIAALEAREDGVRWAAYGPGLCMVGGPVRSQVDGEARHAAFQTSRECLEMILAALAGREAADADIGTVRSMLIQPLAENLVELGDLEAADAMAAAELERAAAAVSFVRGNAQYSMNQVRGRVALRRGDHEAAMRFLRRAGRTEGSPQLSSFGPRFVLARELLEVGERAAVREFLELVRGFWTGPDAQVRLDEALATIDAGNIPNGVNWR
jgi:hypothetical protein